MCPDMCVAFRSHLQNGSIVNSFPASTFQHTNTNAHTAHKGIKLRIYCVGAVGRIYKKTLSAL